MCVGGNGGEGGMGVEGVFQFQYLRQCNLDTIPILCKVEGETLVIAFIMDLELIVNVISLRETLLLAFQAIWS